MRSFRRALRALEREVELSLASQTECCGVTSAQCHLLLAMAERGTSSVGELALELELDQSTLSRTADGLVKAGLASRAEDEGNRRRVLLGLTAAGKKKAEFIDRSCDAYYEDVLAEAGPERRKSLAEDVAFLAQAIRAKRKALGSCCSPKEKDAR
jgi:DNA-binding MarR family transcriptional regulator